MDLGTFLAQVRTHFWRSDVADVYDSAWAIVWLIPLKDLALLVPDISAELVRLEISPQDLEQFRRPEDLVNHLKGHVASATASYLLASDPRIAAENPDREGLLVRQ